MQILVILAHPDKNSFNHAVAQTAVSQLRKDGHDVIVHDLYEEKFDPLLPSHEIPDEAPLPWELETHCRELSSSDGIIIIHPNWWGQPPAILKGWIDRVVRPGVAYTFLEGDTGEGIPVGLLKAKTAVVFNTANTPSEREQEAFGDPLQLLWKNCIFDLCGIPNFYRKMFSVIVTSTSDQRRLWLAEVQDIINRHFPDDGYNKNK
jgi:NAD(P)H dehydrogenase (quinone)